MAKSSVIFNRDKKKCNSISQKRTVHLLLENRIFALRGFDTFSGEGQLLCKKCFCPPSEKGFTLKGKKNCLVANSFLLE